MTVQHRLRSAEARIASQPQQNEPRTTPAEWAEWRRTGVYPPRWLSSPALMAQARQMEERAAAVDQMMLEWDQDAGSHADELGAPAL